MAEPLTELPQRARYRWDEWTDGRPWLLVRGEDFTIEADKFRDRCYMAANRRRLKAVTGGARVARFHEVPAELLAKFDLEPPEGTWMLLPDGFPRIDREREALAVQFVPERA